MVDKILRVPITNIYGGGDYTAQISIGSNAVKANAILDTGSSTLAVVPKAYNVDTDTDHESVTSYIAVTEADERRGFGDADGIMGLAYNVINNAYDLGLYLTGQGRQPQAYPWPFQARTTSAALQQFMRFLQRMPEQDLKPWFTALEEEGFAKNILRLLHAALRAER